MKIEGLVSFGDEKIGHFFGRFFGKRKDKTFPLDLDVGI